MRLATVIDVEAAGQLAEQALMVALHPGLLVGRQLQHALALQAVQLGAELGDAVAALLGLRAVVDGHGDVPVLRRWRQVRWQSGCGHSAWPGYSARSARAIRPARPSLPVRLVRPMLMVTLSALSSQKKCCCSSWARSFSASCWAVSSAVFLNSTMNSSPPQRQTMSERRRDARNWLAKP